VLLLASSGASASMLVGMHLGQRRFERTFLQAVAKLVRFSPLVFVFFFEARQLLACMHAWSGEAVRQLHGAPVPSHFFS